MKLENKTKMKITARDRRFPSLNLQQAPVSAFLLVLQHFIIIIVGIFIIVA
jgi:hypothetical protein